MADSTTVETITMRQHKALVALLGEPTIRQAALVSGVPEKTLYNWLKEPAFTAEYRVMRRDATKQAIAQLQQYSGAAARTLIALMASGNPAAVRLAAASKVLDLAIKSVELEDVLQRLEALEAKHGK